MIGIHWETWFARGRNYCIVGCACVLGWGSGEQHGTECPREPAMELILGGEPQPEWEE